MTLNRSFAGFVGLLLLASPFVLPAEAVAHAKGLYKTQAQAEQRAKELG